MREVVMLNKVLELFLVDEDRIKKQLAVIEKSQFPTLTFKKNLKETLL